jgi:hypothetical protein
MILVSRIAGWLREDEAPVNAVAGTAVLTGIQLHE